MLKFEIVGYGATSDGHDMVQPSGKEQLLYADGVRLLKKLIILMLMVHQHL